MAITVGKLTFEKPIGTGSFGTVFSGFHSDSRQPVAVKKVYRQHDVNESNRLLRLMETEVMEKASGHPNILGYICTEKDADFLYIATELCNGTLEDYFQKEKYQGPEFESDWQILYQATQGLAHLHRKGIVHRDIKPTNILVFVIPSANDPQIKLADFGISKILKIGKSDFTNTSATNPAGTRGWMAPEVYLLDRFDFKVDMFALGCIFGYALSKGNKHPFGDDNNARIFRIRQKQGILLTQKELKAPHSIDDVAIKLIQSMLETESEKRPTAKDVLKNVFFVTDSVRTRQLLEDLSTPRAIRLEKLPRNKDEMIGLNVNIRDTKGCTPLHYLLHAICNDFEIDLIEVITFFLKNGADVNAKTAPDADERTPFHILCEFYDRDNLIQIAKLLIDNGADVNAKMRDGISPLHLLCRYYKYSNLIDIVKLLIRNGVHVNAKMTDNQQTPLHLLCQYYSDDNLVELAQFLIENGADVNAKTKDGKTPLRLACVSYKSPRLTELVQLLCKEEIIDVNYDNKIAASRCNKVSFDCIWKYYCFISLIIGISLVIGGVKLVNTNAETAFTVLFFYAVADILFKLSLMLSLSLPRIYRKLRFLYRSISSNET